MRRLMIAGAGLVAACSMFPNVPEGKGSADARLYVARCGECHKPVQPIKHTAEQWERLLTLIERRLDHLEMKPLTAQDQAQILAYLGRHARPPEESSEPLGPPRNERQW